VSQLRLLCLLILSTVTVSIAVCLASPFQYMCEIKNVFEVSDEGTLRRYNGESAWVGQKIAIDRHTGRVIGRMFDNDTASTIQILDHGSSEQSFKLLSVCKGAYIQTDFLTVNEYSKTPKKPFVGVRDSTTYSGLCD